MSRGEVFFQEKFRGVGDRLKQAGGADAIWSDPVLDQRADPAFRIDGVIHDPEHDSEERDDLDQ